MHRFHAPQMDLPLTDAQRLSARITLDREQTYHARKVLRLTVGDRIELFNGQGVEAVGSIAGEPTAACYDVTIEQAAAHPRPRVWVDLAVALPKGPRADQLIEQASQLGVDRLIPLRVERSTVEPRDAKLQRFQRIAVESAKQCRRPWLLEVAEPTLLETLLEEPHDVRLIALPTRDGPVDLPQLVGSAQRVLALVGPEGGFTDLEVHIALTAGCLRWRLGPHVMRIETAAAAAAAILRHAT